MALQMIEKRMLGASLESSQGLSRHFSMLSGVSMPSSRNLWDILKRSQIEPHDAKHIADIWTEVRLPSHTTKAPPQRPLKQATKEHVFCPQHSHKHSI
jgi:hypothetical protein